MFTLYTVLLTLHILLVVAWVGAGLTQAVIGQRVVATARGADFYADELDWFGQRWFPLVSGLTGVVGILLWIDGPWGLGEPWLIIAVVGWLISSAVGATQLGPRVARWREEGHRLDDPTFKQFQTLVRVDIVLLLEIIVDMVLKPGL
jgi:uncharacterized membrane protein